MEQDTNDLSETLVQIYVKNLHFLEENFNDLYIQIEELSRNFNTEILMPKYSLEFRENYFDILNLEEKSWFYNLNSYFDADQRADYSNFTKDGSLDLLRKGIDGKRLAKSESFKDVLPIVDYINEIVDFDNVEFQKIYKFIFIGSGLGIHMHEINKKLNPMTTLIIESDLEIFRLSLFVTDYTVFQEDNKKLFLAVGGDKTKQSQILSQFYNYHAYMNYNVKYNMLLQSDELILNDIKNYFATNTSTSFPYSLTLKNIHKTMKLMRDGERFFDVNKMKDNRILKDKPTLVIAAGPSLDNYIDWIFKNQHKFIIVCVDVILLKLEKYNIIPDIVVSIDPSHLCANYLKTENKEFLSNSALVFLTQQDESVFEVIGETKKYFSQSIPLMLSLGYLGSVSNVGAFSFMMAVHFGANKVYTIGNDAAFNQETGSRYSSDSSYDKTDSIAHLLDNKNTISDYDIVEVRGNLRDIVKTNRVLMTFKDSFEAILVELRVFHDNFEVYNLSDGVFLEGFIPMDFEEIQDKSSTFESKTNSIHELLDRISTIVDVPKYDKELNVLIAIINKAKKYKKTKITSRNNFLEQKLNLMIWVLEQSKQTQSPILGNMFLQYTDLVDIYINFLLNLAQKDIHDIEHLNTINKFWVDGVITVISDIKKSIS